jgi:hypothetical protein
MQGDFPSSIADCNTAGSGASPLVKGRDPLHSYETLTLFKTAPLSVGWLRTVSGRRCTSVGW